MNACRLALLSALSVPALLGACSRVAPAPEAQRPPLEGARIGGPFTLTDQNGRTVTDASFAGRYRIVYFGYTYCPDVCPTDMQHLGAAMKLLDMQDPVLARRIVPIFISVDPARDTPAVLRQYVANFDPRLIGLTGSADAIARTAKTFAVYYKKGAATADGGYMVDHSVTAYLMDPAGKPLALLPIEGEPAAIAAEIRRWATP